MKTIIISIVFAFISVAVMAGNNNTTQYTTSDNYTELTRAVSGNTTAKQFLGVKRSEENGAVKFYLMYYTNGTLSIVRTTAQVYYKMIKIYNL